MYKIKQRGFTLIELLVVIAIIGILSTLAVLALGNTRSKARDSKRMTDLNQIGKALDLYYADQSYYPTIITPGNSLTSPDGTKVYMAKIPNNPTPRNDNGAPDLDYVYSTDITTSNPPNKYELSTSLGTPVNTIPAGRISVAGSGGSSAPWSCGQNISDQDGNTYTTVQIGSQCWMKQHLNVGTQVSGVDNPSCTPVTGGHSCQNNDSLIEKYCYEDNVANCNANGGLYEWQEAMNLPASCSDSDCLLQIQTPHQGLCPIGWHIPTDNEFKVLEIYLGMSQQDADLEAFTRGTDQGTKLKVSGTSGFDAKLAGDRGSGGGNPWNNGGTYAFIWQATQGSSSGGWIRYVILSYSTIARSHFLYKSTGASVRCLKD